jgi:hypothetical protein
LIFKCEGENGRYGEKQQKQWGEGEAREEGERRRSKRILEKEEKEGDGKIEAENRWTL